MVAEHRCNFVVLTMLCPSFPSDAKRPCSTCVRSHAYAQAHASPNDRLSIPEHPDCTYDDGG